MPHGAAAALIVAVDPGELPTERFGMLHRLTVAQWATVRDACCELRVMAPGSVFSRKGQPLSESILLVDGLIGRHVANRRGQREMVAIEVPGDFVDLHGMPLGHLDHDVTVLSESVIAVFRHERLKKLVDDDPELAIALWAMTLIDAAVHRHWSFRLGRLATMARIANFLCEVDTRLGLSGRSDASGFALPLTQNDLADACGVTPVHVNRVLRDLREGGYCSIRDGRVHFIDRDALYQVAEFDPSYLYISSYDL